MSKVDYLSEDNIVPIGQNFVCISFLTDPEKKSKMNGIKVRGVFSSQDEASEHAKKLQQIDPYFNVFVGEVGKWLPFDPEPTSENAGNPEYANDQLNGIMKGYIENQNKSKIFHEKRKLAQMREGIEKSIETSKDNVKEIQQKVLESSDNVEIGLLNEKIKSIEKQIKSLEDKTKEIKKNEKSINKKLDETSELKKHSDKQTSIDV